MPMKKTSTPSAEFPGTTDNSRRALSPRKTTIAFLRQYARAYMPVNSQGLPGIVLN